MSEMGDNKTGEREKITVTFRYMLFRKQTFKKSHFTVFS